MAQAFHQVGVAFPVDVFDDTKNSAFGIDGSHGTVVCDPHLRQIIPDKMITGHRRGGFAATAGCRTHHPGNAPAGPLDAGDKHVLGNLLAFVFINRAIHRKAMVALFHQQGVAGIGAVEAVGSQVTAVHVNPGIGQIFRPVQAFAVDVGVEMPELFDLLIKIGIDIAVEDGGAVHDISRAGYFKSRIGCRRAHRTPQEKSDHHRFAFHDAGHFFPDIFQHFSPIFFLRQRTDLFALIIDVERPVNNAALLLLQIIMNRVAWHGQR